MGEGAVVGGGEAFEAGVVIVLGVVVEEEGEAGAELAENELGALHGGFGGGLDGEEVGGVRGVDGFLELEDLGADLFFEEAGASGELDAG